VKFFSSQLAYLIGNRDARANLRTLLKYLLTLLAVITLHAILFHVIKGRVEGEQHTWITGFYWTLVVMTTLGRGDLPHRERDVRVHGVFAVGQKHSRLLRSRTKSTRSTSCS